MLNASAPPIAVGKPGTRKTRAWSWLLPASRRSVQPCTDADGRPKRAVRCRAEGQGATHDRAERTVAVVSSPGHGGACFDRIVNVEQHSAVASRTPTVSGALPAPLLFSNIRSCSSWLDCQRLLSANAEQLDAMLLSTLVAQTVYVQSGAEQHQTAGRSQVGHSLYFSSAQDALQAVDISRTGRRVRSSVRPRGANSKVTFSHYLQQLADISLLLIRGFRPQQLSNVLWGLAKCGYKPSAVFIDTYLAQAELQLVRFSPRHLAQTFWALAVMQAQPSQAFSASFLAETSDRLHEFKPQDIANTLWALAKLQIQPPPDWLHHAFSAAERQWVRFKPQELSITLWGFAKLGFGFRSRPASPGLSAGGEGVSPEGLDKLLAVLIRVMPLMKPQEMCCTLWGLAVGQADLAPQQLQMLAILGLCVLNHNQLSSSSRSRDLCQCVWALARLGWTPSARESHLLLSLLQQQQQYSFTLSSSSSSEAPSPREAATLLWCLGQMRIRPPAEIMKQLLQQVQQNIASPAATAADAVQALAACRALSWRPSKPWWKGFYRNSVWVLRDGTVTELARIVAYAAALVPMQPGRLWWQTVWKQVGASCDGTYAAYGLRLTSGLPESLATQHSRPHSSSSSSGQGGSGDSGSTALRASTAAASAEAAPKPRRRRIAKTNSASTSASRGAAASVQQQQQQQEEDSWNLTALLADAHNPWLGIQQTMDQLTRLRAAAHTSGPPAPGQTPRFTGQTSILNNFDLVNPQSTTMLLWSCAKLRRTPLRKPLWQLLVLVCVDLHSYTPGQLTCVMWSVAVLFAVYGKRLGTRRIQCYKVLKLLVVGAQWRLHTGLAGDGGERKNYIRALKFLAHYVGVTRLLVLDYRPETSDGHEALC